MKLTIIDFIDNLRSSDGYIVHIYTMGGCYSFYKLLSSMFDGIVPYISMDGSHIVSKYRCKYYDITGVVKGNFRVLLESDLKEAESWSFRNNNLLKITECPFCDEPITYNVLN